MTSAPSSTTRPAPIVRVAPRDTAGQLPPHDLDAERALVACAYHAPAVLEAAAPKVAPGDFYGDQHATIWRALLSLRAEGEPTDDAPTLIRRLRESASAETCTYATRIVVDDTGYTGTVAHAERYVEAVASMARRRRKIVAAQRAEATLRDTTDADAEARAVELLAEVTGDVEAVDRSAGLHITDPFEGELPAVEWTVPGLELSPGRPSVFAGYSGEGKSFAAYALAVALAAGRPIWGEFPVPSPKRVLIVDMEQGKRPTLARIRRLAKGIGLRPEHFRDGDGTSRLQVRSLPRVSLLAADAHEQVERLTAGFDLVIFDSLKKLIPGADENSAEVEAYTRKLFEVSEATRRAFLVIVHTGKAKEGRSGVSLESLRGSSAMAGDFGSTWIVTYDKATRTHTLHHAKASLDSDAGKREPIVLAFRAGEPDGSAEGPPLCLDAICPEELAERVACAGTSGTSGTSNLDGDVQRVMEVLHRIAARGEAWPTSKDAVARLASMKLPTGRAAVDEAVRRGLVVRVGTARAPSFTLASPMDVPTSLDVPGRPGTPNPSDAGRRGRQPDGRPDVPGGTGGRRHTHGADDDGDELEPRGGDRRPEPMDVPTPPTGQRLLGGEVGTMDGDAVADQPTYPEAVAPAQGAARAHGGPRATEAGPDSGSGFHPVPPAFLGTGTAESMPGASVGIDGHRPTIPPELLSQLLALHREGRSSTYIAAALDLDVRTVLRLTAKHAPEAP